MKITKLLFLTTAFFLFGCNSKSDNTLAFYYWKTTLNQTEIASEISSSLGMKTVYIRFFDVDWSLSYQDAVPLGILDVQDKNSLNWAKKHEIVPTVFINNRVFKKINKKQTEVLADKMVRKITQLGNRELEMNDGWFKEYQVDCDWTESTKELFFYFLETMKKKMPERLTLSCTIRLHQYRDRKIQGIPPVDRGMLMCYNVADPKNHNTKNSILDAVVVEQYLRGDRYPVPLEVALPLFSWGVWYRNHEYQGILSGWDESKSQDETLYAKAESNFYQVKQDTVIGNNYLREGDMIRLDAPFEEELNKTIDLINKRVKPKGGRVVFFDWDNSKINRYGTKNIHKYFNRVD